MKCNNKLIQYYHFNTWRFRLKYNEKVRGLRGAKKEMQI